VVYPEVVHTVATAADVGNSSVFPDSPEVPQLAAL